MCSGGTTCGTACNPGYTYNGTDCVCTSTEAPLTLLTARARAPPTARPAHRRGDARGPGRGTASPTRIVSVIKSTPTTAGCPGTQSYSSSNSLSCSSSCLLGPTSGNDYCGTSKGPTTYCCYRPNLLWTASTNPSANPTNVAAYPFFSIPVTVGHCSAFLSALHGVHTHTCR